MHDIAILDDIVLAFQTPFAGIFRTLFALVRNEVFVAITLCADETAFEIAVNHTGGLWGGRADRNGPGADFLYAGGKVGRQIQ